MMSMLPVIGSNTGGTKELIENNLNGLTYEQGNFSDLADKIEVFLRDRKQIEIMGTNAYNFARKKFVSSINAKNILNVYNRELKNKYD